jgi:hypothetical protein
LAAFAELLSVLVVAGADCDCAAGCDSGAGAGVAVLFGAEVRADVLGEGSNSGADLTEFLPMVKPMPKNIAHRITSPKKSASILPVPRVISVSTSSSAGNVPKGLIKLKPDSC